MFPHTVYLSQCGSAIAILTRKSSVTSDCFSVKACQLMADFALANSCSSLTDRVFANDTSVSRGMKGNKPPFRHCRRINLLSVSYRTSFTLFLLPLSFLVHNYLFKFFSHGARFKEVSTHPLLLIKIIIFPFCSRVAHASYQFSGGLSWILNSCGNITKAHPRSLLVLSGYWKSKRRTVIKDVELKCRFFFYLLQYTEQAVTCL